MAKALHRGAALALGILTAGCGQGCDLLGGLTPYLAPTGVQVLLLDTPLDSLGADYGADLPETGTTLSVTLFRVGQSGTAFTEDDLLSGATVTLFHPTFPGGEGLNIPESPDQRGLYVLSSAEQTEDEAAVTPLHYYPGTNYRIEVRYNGELYEISQVVPDKTALIEPRFEDYVAGGESLRVSWEPAEPNAFVGVFNSEGQYIFSNFPTDPSELYGFLTQPPATTFTLEPSVLEADDIYVLAAAAVRRTQWDTCVDDNLCYISDNLNPLGSVFLSGSAAVTAVTTVPLEFATLTMVGAGDDSGVAREGEDSRELAPAVEVTAMGVDLMAWFSGESDLDPITDPAWLYVPGGTSFPLMPDPSREGVFSLAPEDAAVFQYLPGETYKIYIEEEDRGRARWVSGAAAPAIILDRADGEETLHVSQGDELSLRWSPPVDGLVLQVYNADGVTVYEDQLGDEELDPEGPYEAYEVPSWVFRSGPGLYSVGVAGLTRTNAFSDIYALNVGASAFITGQSVFAAVSVDAAPSDAPSVVEMGRAGR